MGWCLWNSNPLYVYISLLLLLIDVFPYRDCCTHCAHTQHSRDKGAKSKKDTAYKKKPCHLNHHQTLHLSIYCIPWHWSRHTLLVSTPSAYLCHLYSHQTCAIPNVAVAKEEQGAINRGRRQSHGFTTCLTVQYVANQLRVIKSTRTKHIALQKGCQAQRVWTTDYSAVTKTSPLLLTICKY